MKVEVDQKITREGVAYRKHDFINFTLLMSPLCMCLYMEDMKLLCIQFWCQSLGNILMLLISILWWLNYLCDCIWKACCCFMILMHHSSLILIPIHHSNVIILEFLSVLILVCLENIIMLFFILRVLLCTILMLILVQLHFDVVCWL